MPTLMLVSFVKRSTAIRASNGEAENRKFALSARIPRIPRKYK
jgi:hypothetical protein